MKKKANETSNTESFYTEILGLEVAFRIPPENVFFHSPSGSDLLHFMKSREKLGRSQGLDHFGFKLSKASLKEIEKKLKKNSVEIEGRTGRSSIYFRDPNGYMVEFYCD